MALNTDLKDMAKAIRTVMIGIAELNLDEDSVYLYEVPQNFEVPAGAIRLLNCTLRRLNPQQGQWQATFRVELLQNPMSEPERAEQCLDNLATLMVEMMKNATLGDTAIAVEVAEGSSELFGTTARDQGVEYLGFNLGVYEEPVEIPVST